MPVINFSIAFLTGGALVIKLFAKIEKITSLFFFVIRNPLKATWLLRVPVLAKITLLSFL